MRPYKIALCYILAACAHAPAQEVRVLSESAVSSLQNGSNSWYGIDADPENPKNLIACAMSWNSEDNAEYGYVYASQDGGNIWHTALVDKNSKWVSEESCAFGMHGVAYFVADASSIDNAGRLHHDHGITRIWVSHDGGRSWALGTTAGWTDFSAPVVDRRPGPNQNMLYIFFNSMATYYASVGDKGKPANFPKSTDKVDAFDTAGNTIGLLSYKAENTQINDPVFDPEMYKLRLHGSYPGQNVLLRDGSLLTLFWSKRRLFKEDGKRKGREYIFAAQRTDPQRKLVSKPVFIQTAVQDAQAERSAWKCSSYLSAPAVYDPKTNTVYAAYLDGSNDKCTLMLERSTDDGLTWTSSPWAEKAASGSKDAAMPEHDYLGLALARRADGMLALLWTDRDQPDTWLFATSTDDGKTYSHPQQISTGSRGNGAYRVADRTLGSYISQAAEKDPTDDAGLRIDNHTGGGFPHINSMTVTPDGVFHPIWKESTGGLFTASITVTKPRDRSKPEPARTDGWQYETNRVKFTYGGSQRYDEQNGVLTETVVIGNSGTEPLRGALRLEITPRSSAGVIYPLDAVTDGSGDSVTQYLDVSQYIPGEGLTPGTSSAPIPLRLRFEPYSDAKQNSSAAYVSLRLLTKGQEK